MKQTFGRIEMSEKDKWIIEGRDVFIDRWGDNGLEVMTVEEAETRLNEYETMKKRIKALAAELDESLTREAHLQHDMLVVEKENKALRANVSKSVLRRLDAQFTGGTTPTYFSGQNKETDDETE